MAEQQNDRPKLPFTSILALMAVVSGLLVSQIPLKTSRPIGKEAESQVFVGDERVQSRLWQDPFEAVEAHLEKERKRGKEFKEPVHGHHRLGDLARVIHALAPHDPSFIMMPVLADGSPYSNGIESRLRHRYAIVSGLGAAEYLPEAAEYLRFFQGDRQPCDEPPCPSLLVPVEWYKPKPGLGTDAPHVLIFWLQAQDFGDKPLTGLARFVEDLKQQFTWARHRFKILGPRGSGGLAAMVQEAKEPSDALEPLRGVEIFSSWATAEDTFLIGNSPDDQADPSRAGRQARTVEDIFSRAGLSLYRIIGTDAVLAEQLIKELRLRNVDVTASCTDRSCPHHVALISEWDSLYGRVLPRTFVAVAKNHGSGESGPALTRHIDALRRDNWPRWAHHYSYLAGLDGELPPKGDDQDDSASSTGGNAGQKAKREDRSLELPEGRGQLDYLRRLAKTLQEAASDIPGGYRAIGVLGSDVYDKLLILQALRKSFPQAIFFTTDLDARLAHPAQWAWTRNLIIASHFGLELRQDMQQSIPPFRDSYQTALFFSVLQALQDGGKRNVITGAPPRVYEIGRHGAFDLSAFGDPEAPFTIHPERSDLDPATGYPRSVSVSLILLIAGALLLILLCAMLISSQVWTVCINLATSRRFWAIMIVALGTGIGLVLWAMSDGADGEPFVLTEGISVWPTQAIRFLSFLLCGAFFLYSGWSLRRNEAQLRNTFALPALPSSGPSESWFERMIGIHRWLPGASTDTTIAHVWLTYLHLGRWENRWMRYSLQAVLYLCFGGLLMQVFGLPHTPCRGAACFSMNIAVLTASVLGMVLLIFFIVDATRLCRRLIKHLAEDSVQWPDEFLDKEARKRGVGKAFVHEWLCIDLIAARTAVIGHLIYYPFIIVFLMYVARHSYFDRWDLPFGLVVLLSLNVAYAFGNAVGLRHSAEKARRAALARLKANLLPLSDHVPEEKESQRQIERAMDAIKNNHEGAFLPVTAHPLFGAIALPSGGYGVVLLMEYLANTF